MMGSGLVTMGMLFSLVFWPLGALLFVVGALIIFSIPLVGLIIWLGQRIEANKESEEEPKE